jgi:Cys-rich protein (TIGR01571 family)
MSKIEELSGGIFNCFDDMGICCYVYCCAPCAWGQITEDAGIHSCMMGACLICCVPCWYPLGTSMNQEEIDKKMGGQGMGMGKTLLCQCCCGPCTICAVARAVKKGRETGLLKIGAPQQEEMTQ